LRLFQKKEGFAASWLINSLPWVLRGGGVSILSSLFGFLDEHGHEDEEEHDAEANGEAVPEVIAHE
jgi:hypothetical protein